MELFQGKRVFLPGYREDHTGIVSRVGNGRFRITYDWEMYGPGDAQTRPRGAPRERHEYPLSAWERFRDISELSVRAQEGEDE